MVGTKEAINSLRDSGYAVTAGYVAWLIRDSWLPSPEKGPGGCLCWTEADVDRLESLLKRKGRGPRRIMARRMRSGFERVHRGR